MGKGSNLYFQQQQARQLREMEKHQAAQSGRPLRKLTWTERNVLGLKDEPSTPPPESGAESEWTAEEEARYARLRRKEDRHTANEATEAVGVPSSAAAKEVASSIGVRGYLISVTWDGQTLTVIADNKIARVALQGKDHGEGPLVLQADEIASTELKPAGALTNGRIAVRTRDRRTFLLHFRRKSNAEFARLYKALPG
jgi:hypothetical protein